MKLPCGVSNHFIQVNIPTATGSGLCLIHQHSTCQARTFQMVLMCMLHGPEKLQVRRSQPTKTLRLASTPPVSATTNITVILLISSSNIIQYPPIIHQLSSNYPPIIHQLSTNYPPIIHQASPRIRVIPMASGVHRGVYHHPKNQ